MEVDGKGFEKGVSERDEASCGDRCLDASRTTTRCAGQRRLLQRKEVCAILQLENEQFQSLVNTRQITLIRIAGAERFDSSDIDRLIDGYKATASRRPL